MADHDFCRGHFRPLLRPCAVIALMVVLTTGCANEIQGKWKSVQSEANEGTLRFESLDIRNDHSILARAVVDGQVSPIAAKYTYEWGRLTLDTFSGKVREYDVTVWWGRKMEWREQEDGKTIFHRFDRVEKEQTQTPGLFERDPSRS